MSTVEIIKEELKEEKEELELLYKLWDIYETTEHIYYNIPLPNEIIRISDNEFGYNNFTNPDNLREYKEKLKYYKKVAEFYDSNDFVIDEYRADGDFFNTKHILEYFISPETRRRVHGMCKELEESIEKLES